MVLFINLFLFFTFIANSHSLSALTFKYGIQVDTIKKIGSNKKIVDLQNITKEYLEKNTIIFLKKYIKRGGRDRIRTCDPLRVEQVL